MAKPVNEGRAKGFVLYYFLPTCERKVCGGDRSLLSGPERQVIEDLLSTLLVKADISELITDDQVVRQEAVLEFPQSPG